HVVILPHVIKDLSDDLVACRAVAEVVAGPDVTFVEELLPPAQIRALAAQATVTVTGRMHLSIMSLMGGTPAVTMATQGKVEGLMELIGAPELCVSPAGDFAGPVIASLAHVMPPSSATRAAIAAGLPRVIELARANTAGLDEPVLSTAGTSS
ncbi:MAG: polysaccharide pyruvyl transferase family protein, partial [Leifsonia flava]